MKAISLIQQLDEERAACVQRAGAAVVGLVTDRSSFSGIALSDTLVATAAERVARAETIEVRGASGRARGELEALDLPTDVALISCERVWQENAPASHLSPTLGSSVVAIGREQGELAASWGMIRRLGAAWHSRRGGLIERRIELAVRLSPSSEGGALIDAAGRLVGMAVQGPRARTLAIPPETLARWVSEVQAHGRVRRAFLGLHVMALPIRPERWQQWGTTGRAALLVSDVVAGSPAEKAGMDIGDLVLSIDGEPLEGAESLLRIVNNRPVGSELRLRRRRGSSIEELALTLGERSD